MKYALVTGSARGIGYATAKKLTDNGYFVFTNGVNGNGTDLPNTKHVKADLSSVEGAETLLKAADGQALDCVVFNAGTTYNAPFGEIDIKEWQRVMNMHVNIPLYLSQKLNIAENGSIVFIASAMAFHPHSVSLAYGVSKAAGLALGKNLVKEFACRKIRINVVCPGFIDTDWQKQKPDWLRTKIENKTALKRFGTPEEVADLVLSAVDNGFINGSVLTIDGGYDYE
jgi:3-oxoacyl-[acyl-carrier protein] reductase